MTSYMFVFVLILLCVPSSLSVVITKAESPRDEKLIIQKVYDDTLILNKTEESRDKRALGIVLQGLVGAFGYSPSSVQYGTLPNPNTSNTNAAFVGLIGQIPTTTASTPPAPITYPPGSTIPLTEPPLPQLTYPPELVPPAPTRPAPPNPAGKPNPAAPGKPNPPAPGKPNPAPPRQRETLRFTGVLNFGNNSDILGHLQQYERLFHPVPNATTPAPMSKIPVRFPTDSKPPLLPPFLIRIPLPIAPNLPAPLLPASGPISKEYETEYRRNEDTENYHIESKELNDPETVINESPKTVTVYSYDTNPYWKKLYEDRIAEIERQTEKQVEQFVEKANYENNHDPKKDISERNRQEDIKDSNYEKESYKDESESEEEGDRSVEKYEAVNKKNNGIYKDEKTLEHERRNENGSRNEKNENDRDEEYVEYDEDTREIDKTNKSKENDYFYTPKELPINYNREKTKPNEILRNSYGESLENQGQVADFYSMLKNPQNSKYENEKNENIDDDIQDDVRPWGYDGDDVLKRIRQEYDFSDPRSKYEEYELENKRIPQEENESQEEEDYEDTESTKKKPIYQRKFYTNYKPEIKIHENSNIMQSFNEEFPRIETQASLSKLENVSKNPAHHQQFDFIKYAPYYIPVQYQYEPITYEKLLEKIRNAKNISRGFQIQPNEDDLKSTVGLPSEITTKNLSENENKEFRVSPSPFDHTFDSTEQTNIFTNRTNQNDDNNFRENSKNISSNKYYPKVEDNNYIRLAATSKKDNAEKIDIKSYNAEHQSNISSSEESKESQEMTTRKPEKHINTNREGILNNYNNEFKDKHLPIFNSQSAIPIKYLYDSNYDQPVNKESINNSDDNFPHNFKDYYEDFPNIYRKIDNNVFESKKEVNNETVNPSQKSDHQDEFDSQNSSEMNDKTTFGNYYDDYPIEIDKIINENYREDEVEYDSQENDDEETIQSTTTIKPKAFEDAQTAHDFFDFNKDDYEISDENKNVSKAENLKDSEFDKIPEPINYYYDESLTEFTDDPETDTEKVKVKEYRNQFATVKLSEEKQLEPNGATQVTKYIRNNHHRSNEKQRKEDEAK